MYMPLVSIITVNFNQTEATCALLDSIWRQDYTPSEVIVVDNGSVENPAELFARRYPEVIFIRSHANLGFAGGNNLGLQKASGQYLFFINNDAELTDGCLARLIALFSAVPELGIVSPLICYHPRIPENLPKAAPDSSEMSHATVIQYAGMTRVHPLTGRNRSIGEGETNTGQFRSPQPTAYAHGAAMLVSRAVLERVGPMSEDFFLYYEELDWCERIRRSGFSVWLEPRACVYHKESLTVSKLGATKTYYLIRNRILFMRRNFSGWQRSIFFLFLVFVTIPKNTLGYLWKGEKQNLAAFLEGVWWNFFPSKSNTFEKAPSLRGMGRHGMPEALPLQMKK